MGGDGLTTITTYHTVTVDDPFPVHHCSQIMAAYPILPNLRHNSPANSLWATLHSLLSMTTASGRAHSTLLVEPSRTNSTDSRRWSRLVPLEEKGWSLWGQVTVMWLGRRLERRMRAKGKMRVRKVWLFASVLYAKLYTYMYMYMHVQSCKSCTCMQLKHAYYEKRDHLGKMTVVTVWNLWQYPVIYNKLHTCSCTCTCVHVCTTHKKSQISLFSQLVTWDAS